jgi:UV DNA damage endonuclease
MRFGYACIPAGLPESGQRGCILANAAPARLEELIALNLRTLGRCLDYTAGLGLSLFRISSDVVPFGSHPVNRLRWWRTFEPELSALGRQARRLGLRLSMHPGQYTLLSSPSPKVTAAAVADLRYHARLLDALGTPRSSKIVIHLGGVYGDKPAAVARFKREFRALPAEVRERVVLENDERCYPIEDVLPVAEELGLPVVFDRFHYRVAGGEGGAAVTGWLRRARRTWRAADGRQKVHFSSQEPGLRPGAHGRSIVPGEFLAFLDEAEGLDLDIMVEAKSKEHAALAARALASSRARREAAV